MDLAKPKRSLKAYKGHLSRAINNCEDLLNQPYSDKIELEKSITNLETRWNSYEQSYETVEKILLEIEGDDNEIDSLQTDYYRSHETYQQSIPKMRSVLNQITHQTSGGPSAPGTTTAPAASASVLPKLTNLQLPTFSGHLIEYEQFIDQFEAQIESRPDLEPVTKLQFLKSLLEGRALDLVKGYSSTSTNYDSALNTLKETYGDKERIKHCLLHKITSTESSKHDKTELKSFRRKMLNYTRSLRNKHNFDCCERMIASLFEHELSTTTIRQLYLKYEVNYLNLDQLNEGIRDLVSHMEVENQQKPKASKPEIPTVFSERAPERQVGTYFASRTPIKGGKESYDMKCRFCGAGHKDSYCTNYLQKWS